MIRPATTDDAAELAALYNHYIEHTIVSFELTPISADEMVARIERVTRDYPWLVLLNDAGRVAGYAYAGRWQVREAYRHTLETAIYLAHDHVGRGDGTRLYAALFEALAPLGLHSLIAGIALPNEASVRLHEKFGFKKVAHYPEVGYKFGTWIDVGYWQKRLTG